jgi:7-alpha-hydroxysteroid dehydrogenase
MSNVPSLFSMQNKVAIVTGAGKGIGKASAIALAQAGADVALAARTEADLKAVAEEITAMGRRAIVVVCDVTQESDLDNLVERTHKELGAIHVLVNNVGGSGPNMPDRTTAEQLNEGLIWNVTPAFLLIKKTAPIMKESGGGSVINISSAAARFAQKHFSLYGAAKAALNQMTRNLAQDYAPHVRINAIEPGPILTDAFANFLKTDPSQEQKMLSMIPLDRLGQPEDIAASVLFFASDASSWITGKILGVEGGAERLQ